MIEYRDARPDDADALAAMARRCSAETFGHLYTPQNLAAFLDQAFGPAGLPSQIGAPGYAIRLATDDGQIAGYCKMGPNTLPYPDSDAVAQLHQLYVLSPWQGAGIAPALMDWALAEARARDADTLALTVYVDNARAKAFYARYGFVDVGRFDFPVGDQIDEDRLMVLAL